MNQFKSQEMAFENRQRMMEEQQKAIKDKNMGPALHFSHSSDNVAGDDPIPGALRMNASKDKKQDHSIDSFTIENILQLQEGSHRIVDGKIVKK